MLFSEDIAVVPVGISCINAYQISRLRAKFEKMFGCKFTETSSFFRYVFQNPAGISTFFDKFLINNADLELSDLCFEQHDFKSPYMPETGTWFVHEERERAFEETGIRREYSEILPHVKSKYNHLLKKMRSLSEKKKRVFIFGNSDLEPRTWPRYMNGSIEWRFRKEDIVNLCASISKSFPSGENIFIFVGSYLNIIDNIDVCSAFFIAGSNDWKGDDSSWDKIFEKFPRKNEDNRSNLYNNKNNLLLIQTNKLLYTSENREINVDNASVFRSELGFVVDRSAAGNIIWGPYVRLCSGLYEVAAVFDPNEFLGFANLKITKNRGSEEINRRCFNKFELKESNWIIKLRFFVGYDAHYVETCIESLDFLKCCIKKITIEKIC